MNGEFEIDFSNSSDDNFLDENVDLIQNNYDDNTILITAPNLPNDTDE